MLHKSGVLAAALTVAAALAFSAPANAAGASGQGATAQASKLKPVTTPARPSWVDQLLKRVKKPKRPGKCRG